MAKRLGISRGRDTVRTVWVRYIEKTIADEGLDHSGMVDTLNRYFRELVQRAKHTEDIVAARPTLDGGTTIPPARLGFQRQRLQVSVACSTEDCHLEYPVFSTDKLPPDKVLRSRGQFLPWDGIAERIRSMEANSHQRRPPLPPARENPEKASLYIRPVVVRIHN